MSVRPTGVELIDGLLGGLSPGLPCVLAGASGTGRTLLSLQVAAAALEQGRVVTYLCNEPAPFLVQQADGLGFAFTKHIRSGRLALLEFSAEVSALLSAHGMDAFTDALHAEQPLASLMVVDPFSVVTAGVFEESTLRTAARKFVHRFAELELLFSVEMERLALQQGLERILLEVCGAYVRLSRDMSGNRNLSVEKRRSSPGAAEKAVFEVTDRGIEVLELVQPEAAAARPGPPRSAPRRSPPPVERPPSTPAPAPADGAVKASADGESSAPSTDGAGKVAPDGARDGSKQSLVLIVDDDRESVNRMSKWLDGPYRVITARDGFEAMTLFLNHRPDLVILALLMPRVTGYELLSAFQRSASPIPRLVVSSRVQRAADRLSPLVLGATDLLAKPVERFEFLHKVETLLRLSSASDSSVDPAEAEALFATISGSRQLDGEQFGARLARACSFGDRYGMRSTLVTISSRSSKALDGLGFVADELLRFEDAMLRVSQRRAVILLVATELDDAPAVMERLVDRFEEAGDSKARMQWSVQSAQPVAADFDWHELFRSVDAADGDEE